MSLITIEQEALALLLRSKTALGRLTDPEVHSVLAFLESIGFKHHAPTPDEPAVAEPLEPPPVAPVIEPPPAQ